MRLPGLVGIGITVAVVVVYLPVYSFTFLEYDDVAYVLRNPDLQDGLTWSSIRAVFTRSYIASWHPLSMMTHALDVSLFGMNAGMHHVVNVLYHIANSLLLFLVWHRLTGAPLRSGLVAALWAVHPQHVEAVAWISSRKDLVSTMFMLLVLLAYYRYAAARSLRLYVMVAAMLTLGLLAKPMLVTLPFILLLLDHWPLGRLTSQTELRRAVIEKIPFLLICIAFGVVTHIVQSAGGAVKSVADVPLSARLSNVPFAYGHYLGGAFWPESLSIFYPHPMGQVTFMEVLLRGALVVGISAVALLQWRRRPFVFVGWCWFTGSLVPVIGLIQFGAHGMADRYTYVAHIGLFIAVVWLLGEFAQRLALSKNVPVGAGLAAILLLSALSARYVHVFRDDIVLFTYVEETTGPSLTQKVNLGNALLRRGAVGEALVAFQAGFDFRPLTSNVYNNAGVCYLQLERYDLAYATFQEGLRLKPHDERAAYNVEYARAKMAEARAEIAELRKRLSGDAGDLDALRELATRLYQVGELNDAETVYGYLQSDFPNDPAIYSRLGDVYAQTGRGEQAVVAYERALSRGGDPYYLYYWIARCLTSLGRDDEARQFVRRALVLEPPSLEAALLARRL